MQKIMAKLQKIMANKILNHERVKRSRENASAVFFTALLLAASSVPQAHALPFGKDKDAEAAPDTVIKKKLSQGEQTEFESSLKNGNAYLAQSNIELAKICFLRCTTLDPTSADGHLGLAYCFAANNKMDQAQIEIFEALRCDPNKTQTRFLFGDILMKESRFDEAGGQYLQVLKQNPNDLGARGNLANCLILMGQIDAAIPQFKFIIDKDPKSATAAYNLAAAYEMKNMFDDAAQYYKRVIELDPKNSNAYGSLAKCLIVKKDYKSAQVLLKHAKTLGPNNYFLHLMQGFLYESTGERRPAIEEYTRAVALSPQDPDANKSLKRVLENGMEGKVGGRGGLNRVQSGKISGLKANFN